jgi:hypothetical protein
MKSFAIGILLIGLSLFAACTKPPHAADAAVATGTAVSRIEQIPPADPQKYVGIREMKSWRNPYLIVSKDGISLFDVGNSIERPLKSNQLLDALAALPPSAWPYGRVVAVEENRASLSDEDRVGLRRNRAILAGTLEEAKILINWVSPS